MLELIGFFLYPISSSDIKSSCKNVNKTEVNNYSQLFMFNLNIQCLSSKKVDMLSLYLQNFSYDIICIGEHWQSSAELTSINIPGYILRACYCRSARRHGGVAIYSRDTVSCVPVNLDVFSVTLHAEFAAVEFVELHCVIVVVYTSSAHGEFQIFIQKLEQMLDLLVARYRHIFVLGDFNCDPVKFPHEATVLRTTMASFNLFSTIEGYTRVTKTSASKLDDMFTNYSAERYKATIVEPAISDHMGLSVTIDLDTGLGKPSVEMRKCITIPGLSRFRLALSGVNWDDYGLSQLQGETAMSLFMSVLVDIMDSCGVVKSVRVGYCRSNPVFWYSDKLKQMRNTLQALKTVCNTTQSEDDWNAFRAFRAVYRKQISDTKRAEYNRFIVNSDNKQKSCWKIINYETNKYRKNIGKNKSKLSAHDLNSHFVNVANYLVNNLPSTNSTLKDMLARVPWRESSLFLGPVTPSEVFNVIMSLKNKSGLDYYGMNAALLKFVGDLIARPLSSVLNSCITEGCFPQVLKISMVVPIHKKGSVDDVDNYRPITITPILSKVFENVIKTRLLNYFEGNHILDPCQFGFREGRSTIAAVSKLIDEVVDDLDQGKRTEVTLCDLTKAFDCVSLAILLEKLSIYGVRGIPLKLLESYLTNRKQYVNFGGARSEVLVQAHGVPQGSVIGPILFVIYINDLPSNIESAKVILFADDTSLYTSDRCLRDARSEMADAVDQASAWFTTNNLKLNQAKTQNVTLTTDKTIVFQDPVCLLGIKIDQHLTWGPHIDQVCGRVASGIFALRKLVGLVSDRVLKMAYYALVHSHLSYGILLWGGSSGINRAFVLQKRAIRAMTRRGMREHCRPLFTMLEILTLPCMYIFETCMTVHLRAPTLRTRADVHSYGTRGRDLLIIPASKTCVTERNRVNIGMYNALPSFLKILPAKRFGDELKRLLIEHAFYGVDDFLNCRFVRDQH